MKKELRWKQRFVNFENAYNVIARAIERNKLTPNDELVKMALIQAFEFTFELA